MASEQNYPTDDIEQLAYHYKKIIEIIGEDPQRGGLLKTPHRAANALKFLTKGYHDDLNTIVNDAIFETEIDEVVILKNIELYSLCEHHLLPFVGKCHVAYLPTGKVLGVSKIARIIDYYARRMQIQEKLTKQIAECIMEVTDAAGVGVIIEAQHFCMMMRGVEKQNSIMTTSVMLGEFRHDERTRSEFLNLVTR